MPARAKGRSSAPGGVVEESAETKPRSHPLRCERWFFPMSSRWRRTRSLRSRLVWGRSVRCRPPWICCEH